MSSLLKVIVFQLNQQQYGLDINYVSSIERVEKITKMPHTVSFIKGITNLRGKVIPLVDFKERLHLGETNYTEQTRILITLIGELEIGLIVDLATDVIDIATESIEETPNIFKGNQRDYVSGVAKLEEDLLLILDIEKLFNQEEMKAVDEIAK